MGPAVGPVNVEREGGALDVESVQHEDRGHHPGQALRIKRLQMFGDHLNTYRKTGTGTVGGETNLDVGAAQVVAAQPDGVLRVGAGQEVLGELRRPVNHQLRNSWHSCHSWRASHCCHCCGRWGLTQTFVTKRNEKSRKDSPLRDSLLRSARGCL